MGVCPNCAREHDDGDIICVYCGYVSAMPGKTARASTTNPPAPPPTANQIAPPLTTSSSPADAIFDSLRSQAATADAPRTLEQAVAAVSESEPPVVAAERENAAEQRPKRSSRNVVLGAVAIVVVAVVALGRRPAYSDAANAAAAAPARAAAQGAQPSPAASRAVVPVESIPVEVPKWKPTRQSRWARDGSRTMGFEVEAARDVAVYQDRVRPILSVRCVARTTEVFVVLQSAASIENAGDTHTVKIGFDGEPDSEQQWVDSIDKQALFSPDGHALAARLAGARRLRFSFRPFNAAPATVEFDVHGFDQPLATMSKACAPQARRGSQPRG